MADYDSFDDDDDLPSTPRPEEEDEIPPTPPPNEDDTHVSDDSFDRDEIIHPQSLVKDDPLSQDSFENDRILSSNGNSQKTSHDSFDDDDDEIIEEGDELEVTPPPEGDTNHDESVDCTSRPSTEKMEHNEALLNAGIGGSLRHPSDDGMHTVVPLSRRLWGEDPPEDVIRAMKKYFGHCSFRPRQWEIVREVMNGRDVLAIMATGYGKSVCYQLPSLIRGDVTIVISPLLSLIEDQLKALRTNKIRATSITGSTSHSEREDIERDIMRGSINFLYLTPEFIQNADSFLMRIKSCVKFCGIDESHCISQWGNDFRSSYRQLSKLKQLLSPVTILAVTATATKNVAEDIKNSLGIPSAIEIRTNLNRSNIFLESRRATRVDEDLCALLVEDKKRGRHFGGATIIYCQTKDMVKEVSDTLIRAGVRVSMYHAGLSPVTRSKTHDDFLSDRISTVVATIAFGMGIDKPDVRVVIHYGAPKNIESFYQEIGRAGRDGADSRSIVYYTDAQITRNRCLISSSSGSQSEAFRLHTQQMGCHMEMYLNTLKCRRQEILSHFDSVTVSAPMVNCCDNCDRQMQGSVGSTMEDLEVSAESRAILNVIHRVYCGRFGVQKAIDYLRGMGKEEERKKRTSDNLKVLYGYGKGKSDAWWKDLVKQLKMHGHIQENKIPSGFGMVVCVSGEGVRWMNSKEKLFVAPTSVLLKRSSERASQSTSGGGGAGIVGSERKLIGLSRLREWKSVSDSIDGAVSFSSLSDPQTMLHRQQLQEIMYEIRNDLASKMDVAPFHIASNKVVEEISSIVPSCMESISSVSDWSEEKRREFGPHFVTAATQFCARTGMAMDTEKTTERMLTENERKKLSQLPSSVVSSYRIHLQTGVGTAELATMRSLAESTVSNHLSYCALAGLPLHSKALHIDKETRDMLLQVITTKLGRNIRYLKSIMDCFPSGFVDYSKIKMVVSILEYEYGIEGDESEKMKEEARPAKLHLPAVPTSDGPPAFKKKKMAI